MYHMKRDTQTRVSTKKQASERPQDMTFSQAALDRAFGKRLSHSEYLASLKRSFAKKYDEEEQ